MIRIQPRAPRNLHTGEPRKRLESALGVVDSRENYCLDQAIERAAHQMSVDWLPDPAGASALTRPDDHVRATLDSRNEVLQIGDRGCEISIREHDDFATSS